MMDDFTTTRRVSWARAIWYGAELGVALTCVYTVAFIGYAVVRSTVMILATPGPDAGLAGTLASTWLSLALAATEVALLCALPAALLGAATALVIRALLTLADAVSSPARAGALGAAVCLGFSLALVALVSGGLGVAWTPTSAEALTFWLVLPLLIYVVAGGVVSRQLVQTPGYGPARSGAGERIGESA
jgi:hypothetical protein